jgi:MurNAc alpha-1-phosphate uridylyltransferase
MSDALFPMVILAGGLAKRLHPVSQTIPKALINIHGEPFICHQLRLIRGYGIKEVVLCVGYLGEEIEKQIGDGSHLGVRVQYSYDGDPLLGTGGAIKKALPLLNEHFFVLYGDSYLECDYSAVQFHFQKMQQPGLMTVLNNKDQWDTSNIEYANEKIINYDKQHRSPRMHHIDYGLGILSKIAFKHGPENQAYDLALLYKNLLAQNQLAAYEVKKRFYEIGSFSGIKELEDHLTHNLTPSLTI